MKRQINFETAMEVAKRGREVFTLMPTDGSDSWVLMEPWNTAGDVRGCPVL